MAYTIEVGDYTFDMSSDHAYWNPSIEYVLTGAGAIASIREIRHLECIMTAADTDALWVEWDAFLASMHAGQVDVYLKDGGVAKDSLLQSAQARGPNVENITPAIAKGGFHGFIPFSMDVTCERGLAHGADVTGFQKRTTYNPDSITIDVEASGPGGLDAVRAERPSNTSILFSTVEVQDTVNNIYRATYRTLNSANREGVVVVTEQVTITGGGRPVVPILGSGKEFPAGFKGKLRPYLVEISGKAVFYNQLPQEHDRLPAVARSRESDKHKSGATEYMISGESITPDGDGINWTVQYRQRFLYMKEDDIVISIATLGRGQISGGKNLSRIIYPQKGGKENPKLRLVKGKRLKD